MKIGVKAMHAIIIECVGPRCSRTGIRMSMSGITDSMMAAGMLIFVFNSLAEALPEIYPNAM